MTLGLKPKPEMHGLEKLQTWWELGRDERQLQNRSYRVPSADKEHIDLTSYVTLILLHGKY